MFLSEIFFDMALLNLRLRAFIQLSKYDVTLVSQGVIIFATAKNIQVSQFHYTFSYNGYCWEIFLF